MSSSPPTPPPSIGSGPFDVPLSRDHLSAPLKSNQAHHGFEDELPLCYYPLRYQRDHRVVDPDGGSDCDHLSPPLTMSGAGPSTRPVKSAKRTPNPRVSRLITLSSFSDTDSS